MPTAISYATEAEAIFDRLNDEWSATPVAWPNKQYTPTEGTAYIEPNVRGNLPFHTEITPGSKQVRNPGLLTVAVRVPENQGEQGALAYADTLMALFRNFTFSQITFTNPGLGFSGVESPWYRVQVDCPFVRRSVLSPSTA